MLQKHIIQNFRDRIAPVYHIRSREAIVAYDHIEHDELIATSESERFTIDNQELKKLLMEFDI